MRSYEISSHTSHVPQEWSGHLMLKSTFDIAAYRNATAEDLHHIRE